ncbi:Protein-tyrosine-phosphatase MKP1 [Vitis vinifera]|uniref:Protein-tyrosine-phosphatase MKP1 n=1 Tax=Vitis vinifera TaxID=29760 RepID=A0A438CDR7_VITVI|nr:Protein-tyrosine-phosphatase MKP1 [Vitis vinifera]
MLGEEGKDPLPGGRGTRRAYLRSVSWTDRSPTKPLPRPQPNTKMRSCLPPLQPLSISRRNAEEWPRAGSDDLGVWPHPPTPGGRLGSVKPLENSNSEQPQREFQLKKDKLAFFDKECSRIADHIYLGSDAVAKNRETLRQNGITHVLNCVGFVCPEYFKSDLVYKTLWLQDSPSEDITSILYDVFDYFEDVREQGGRVLVHCCQGVSRSNSLVIAYLMWREGQSFEDAFQYVKAARGVTNPNMGFACQLLQCQKRVHAVPVSPNSVLRMYRMAPHSPYDPLHLVPKMLSHPGKNCNLVMSNNARTAACQVIRYERAQGPIVNIKEGEETSEFWDALASGQLLADHSNKVGARDESSSSSEKIKSVLGLAKGRSMRTGSETCLPARENGWGRLRRKFTSGFVKEFVTKLNCDTTQSNHVADMIIDASKEVKNTVSMSDPLSPLTPPCGSPVLLPYSPDGSSIGSMAKDVEHSVPLTDPLSPQTPKCGSPDSFSCFLGSSHKFSSKSPSLSPSTSEYSSSYTFSPSSSNWSDLSYLSSQQPSPSNLGPTDPFCVTQDFSAHHAQNGASTCLPCKGTSPLLLSTEGVIRRLGCWYPQLITTSSAPEPGNGEEPVLEAEHFSDGNKLQSENEDEKEYGDLYVPLSDTSDRVAEVTNPALYQWPSMDKVELCSFSILDSRSVYIMSLVDLNLGTSNPEVLYVWVGHDVSYEKGQSQLTSSDGHARMIMSTGRWLGTTSSHKWVCQVKPLFSSSLLRPLEVYPIVNSKAMGLVEVRVVREGEEPEQLLKYLNCFSFHKTENSSLS